MVVVEKVAEDGCLEAVVAYMRLRQETLIEEWIPFAVPCVQNEDSRDQQRALASRV